jgi:phosphatidylserine/phosphatidylglycerophosphate/cardiolipin synthase-like enzyme
VRTLKEDVAAYIRADEEDTDFDADPMWEDVMDRVGDLVAEAWLKIADDDWLDADGAERPTLVDVIDNAMCTDWLVFADEDEKKRLREATEALIAERGLPDDWRPS